MHRFYFLLITALFVSLCSCTKQSAGSDVFCRDVYTPRYAKGFTIKGRDDSRSVVIETLSPWQGESADTARLLVLRDGDIAPEGFDGSTVSGDVRRIIAMSSTHIAMLDAVEHVDKVKGVSGMSYISNSYIRSHADSIVDVGYDGNVDYERLMSLQPDIVLIYGTNGASPMEGKLRQLGIPYMYVAEYLEESPLGKAEWLVALAETLGIRDKGIEVFERIPERYNALRDSVKSLGLKRPRVMINTPYSGSWFMASTGSYLATLINDAGGDYVYTADTGTTSQAIDIEEAYMLTADADKWINPGTIVSLEQLRQTLPRFADTRPVLNGEVYNTTARVTEGGGNDYWESGAVHPELVLRDMVKIFHPDLMPDTPFVYYQKLK